MIAEMHLPRSASLVMSAIEAIVTAINVAMLPPQPETTFFAKISEGSDQPAALDRQRHSFLVIFGPFFGKRGF